MSKQSEQLREVWERISVERVARGEGKLSRAQLAAQYGVTVAAVNHYLNGQERLNWEWRLRFADFLGVSAWDIWPDLPHRRPAGEWSADTKAAAEVLEAASPEVRAVLVEWLTRFAPLLKRECPPQGPAAVNGWGEVRIRHLSGSLAPTKARPR